MAGSIGVITGIGIANAGVTCMARILGNTGTPITQASINTIAFNVKDLNLLTSPGTGTLLPANVIYNSLQQQDPRWDKDSGLRPGKDGAWGYNFLNLFSHTFFTAFDVDNSTTPPTVKPHKFQIDIVFTPVTGEPFLASYSFLAVPTWLV